jgi:hypothetical protein
VIGDPSGIGKLQGYNEGFNQAVSTFQEIILVLIIGQTIQLITHRLLYREKPFSITIREPFSGEVILRKGFNYKIQGRSWRIIKLINQATFTLTYTLTAFLFLQVFFPAYSFEVVNR